MSTGIRTAPADILISGATALLHDDAGAVTLRADTTIAVADGEIAFVGDHADLPTALSTATEEIDARGQVVMPGLINCHTHSPMVMFRGAADDVPEERWFNDFIWPMEVNLTAEDVTVATRLAAAEMIRHGVTTFADHYFHMDDVARVTEESGQRAVLGSAFFSSSGEAGIEQSLNYALRWRGRANGRITTALAPHAPYTVTDEHLRTTAERAREHNLLVHIHASESRSQTRHSLARTGLTPIGVLERTGMLETKLLIAHGIGIVPEDLPVLQRRGPGYGAAVASAAKGYLKNGFASTPVRALTSVGVPVGLATDGAGSNNTLDVWESMTFMTLVQKAAELDQGYMPAREALRLATTESARALHMEDSIGRLAVGYRADMILVDLSDPRMQPINDLATTLVHSGRGHDVDTTIVEGKILMRNRQIRTIDVAATVAELQQRVERLTDRSHGKTLQHYDA